MYTKAHACENSDKSSWRYVKRHVHAHGRIKAHIIVYLEAYAEAQQKVLMVKAHVTCTVMIACRRPYMYYVYTVKSGYKKPPI